MASGASLVRGAVRSAFTLVELLIVIAIIATLAGLLIPAAGMVRQQANAVKCSSNMRQIAMAVEVYTQNANGAFPDNFPELITLYNLPPKVLLCPNDAAKGTSQYMGRPVAWPDYTRLWQNHQNSYLAPATAALYAPINTSYDFEMSGTDNGTLCTDSDISFFYGNQTSANQPALAAVSWADCKQNEQQFGNYTNGVIGTPFPAGSVPMIRCYFHWDWVSDYAHDANGLSAPPKVNNISMEFNQIWTMPFWEFGFNPAYPHGN